MDFHIYPCRICGKTPIIIKNIEDETDTRYRVSHCSIQTNAQTETQCIVNWNKLNEQDGKENEIDD